GADGESGWFCPAQFLVDVAGRPPVQLRRIGSIAQKPSDFGQPSRIADENKPVPCREVTNLPPMQKHDPSADNDERLGTVARCGLERAVKIARLAYLQRLELYRQCARGALRLPVLGIGMVWVPQDGDPRYPGRDLFEQFNRLSGQLVVDVGQARDISTRPREARHKSACNRIVADNDDDRYRRCRLLDDWCLLAAK